MISSSSINSRMGVKIPLVELDPLVKALLALERDLVEELSQEQTHSLTFLKSLRTFLEVLEVLDNKGALDKHVNRLKKVLTSL